MSVLLERAFGALGPGPSWREIELVADTVRSSGDQGALATLRAAGRGEAFDALTELALASGSTGFAALDLAVEVTNPSAHTALRAGERSRRGP